jgi:hypothetical protein
MNILSLFLLEFLPKSIQLSVLLILLSSQNCIRRRKCVFIHPLLPAHRKKSLIHIVGCYSAIFGQRHLRYQQFMLAIVCAPSFNLSLPFLLLLFLPYSCHKSMFPVFLNQTSNNRRVRSEDNLSRKSIIQ